MIESLNLKIVPVIEPAIIVDNTTETTVVVDTINFARADIVVMLGATDIALTAFNLSESDLPGSGFAAVPGADFATGTQPDGTAATLPSATADNSIYSFGVQLTGGRKRYLKVNITIGAGSAGAYMAAIAILSRPQQMPFTMAQRGYAGQILV